MTKAEFDKRDRADAAYYAHLKKHDERRADPSAWYAKLEKIIAEQRSS